MVPSIICKAVQMSYSTAQSLLFLALLASLIGCHVEGVNQGSTSSSPNGPGSPSTSAWVKLNHGNHGNHGGNSNATSTRPPSGEAATAAPTLLPTVTLALSIAFRVLKV